MANEEKKDPQDLGESQTLNQDGSRLGGGGGGAVANPTGERATRELVIGGPEATLRELGQHREEIAGISGGASAGDKGVSGWIGSDPSGIGEGESEDWTSEGPRFDKT